jgi:hypothetical protein
VECPCLLCAAFCNVWIALSRHTMCFWVVHLFPVHPCFHDRCTAGVHLAELCLKAHAALRLGDSCCRQPRQDDCWRQLTPCLVVTYMLTKAATRAGTHTTASVSMVHGAALRHQVKSIMRPPCRVHAQAVQSALPLLPACSPTSSWWCMRGRVQCAPCQHDMYTRYC